jgi:DNA-binding MarR family transcriptional regulator
MLKARDFIAINPQHYSDEVARLESISAQIGSQPSEAKRQLWSEFLDIVTNRDEELRARILACNMLGGYQAELNLNRPQVVKRLKSVLEDEFIVSKFSKNVFRRRELYLRQMDPIKSCFLPILLSTLLRIDFENTHQIVGRIVDKMENSQFREALSRLYEKQNPTRQP